VLVSVVMVVVMVVVAAALFWLGVRANHQFFGAAVAAAAGDRHVGHWRRGGRGGELGL